MNNKPTISVDVISDVVCPWCYIGKRRLESALESLKEEHHIEVTYHPFQLDPSVPIEGYDFQEYMENRFGAGFAQKSKQVEQVAESVGLDFNFEELPKSINTFNLHRFIQISGEEGIQAEVKEALMDAYFVKRIDLTNPENIVNLFGQFGWSSEKTLEILHSDRGADAVKEEINYYKQMGVNSVPFYVINNKYGIAGAQPAEAFIQTITKVAREMNIEVAAGDSCDIDGENC